MSPSPLRAHVHRWRRTTRNRLLIELFAEGGLLVALAWALPVGPIGGLVLAITFGLHLRARIAALVPAATLAQRRDPSDLLATALAVEAGEAVGSAALAEQVRAAAQAQLPVWANHHAAAERAHRSLRALPLALLLLAALLLPGDPAAGLAPRLAALTSPAADPADPPRDPATPAEAPKLPAAAGLLAGIADRIGLGAGEEARAGAKPEAEAAADRPQGAQAGAAAAPADDEGAAGWGLAQKRQDRPEDYTDGSALPGQLARWGEVEADPDRPRGEGEQADLGAGDAKSAPLQAETATHPAEGDRSGKGASGGGEGSPANQGLSASAEDADGALSDAIESGSGAAGQGGVNESSGSLWTEADGHDPGLRLAAERVSEAWRSGSTGPLRAIEEGPTGGDSAVAYGALFTAYAALAEARLDPQTPPARAAYVRAYFDAIAPEAP